MSRSQLPEGVKDISKFLKGTNYGVNWTITTYLTDAGQYYSTVTANERSQDTVLREDLDSAVADGGQQLNEFMELMGVL